MYYITYKAEWFSLFSVSTEPLVKSAHKFARVNHQRNSFITTNVILD